MPLPCPKCGQYEVVELQDTCPGGCDLSDCWPASNPATPEAEAETAPSEPELPTEAAAEAEEQVVAAEAAPAEAKVAETEAVPLPVEAEIPMALPAELHCPGCQAPVDSTMRFCDSCGWPLVPHCPDCGTDNRAGAKFCRSCGARLIAKPERRGRTRFCPTCGHELTARTTERLTETAPVSAGQPQLPRVETPVPVAVAEEAPTASAEPEAPAALEAAAVEPVAEGLPAREFELLIVKADGTPLAAFPLTEGHNLVGVRSPGTTHVPAVDLSPFDNRKVISRRHALFRVAGNQVLLADCGSTNGTTVNDQALTKTPVEVTEESAIAFAGLRCRIRAK